jgi:3'(2'), 5'-bisphosphate nucleotidase
MLKKVIDISRVAGSIILEVYHNSSIGITYKEDNSPLTIADKRASDYICDELYSLDKDIPIICEEIDNVPFDVRKNYKRFWLVDPLDGTKEFIKKNGEFTVNIALIEDNKVILGVVHVPCTDDTYFAEKNEGAWLLRDQKRRKLHVNRFSLDDKRLKIVCSRSHLNDDTKEYMKRFNGPEIVRTGSSLKFMKIASGEADIYPRLGLCMEWDTGASQIIVEEAGGKVLQYDNKEESVVYNKVSLYSPFFIASGAIV